jgi:nitrogen regulatory protein PII
MKYVVGIVQTHKFEDIRDALLKVGIEALTAYEVKRYGAGMGHREVYRAEDYEVGFMPHTRIEFVATDEEVDKAVETLREATFNEDIADEGIVIMQCDWQIL